MIAHDFVFISSFLGELEKETILKFGIRCLLCLNFGFFVVAESVEAASFVRMQILIIFRRPFHELIINVHGLFVVAVMESAICDA